MQRIISKDNKLIKHIKKLKEKKYRDEAKEYIIEGVKLIEEAIRENAQIAQIIVCEGCAKSELIETHLKYEMAKFDCISVPENVFKVISEVENPQGILAIIKRENNKEEIDFSQDIIVALDDIQDPGNLGTILRTVDSVGLSQILVSKGTTDCFSPKVVRSTMGAIFRIKIIECEDLENTLKEIQKNHYKIMVTSLEAKKTIYDVDYNKKVIIVGNEANGVSKKIQKLAEEKVIIPMLGKTESLNVSVATGVVLYEYVRRKIDRSK